MDLVLKGSLIRLWVGQINVPVYIESVSMKSKDLLHTEPCIEYLLGWLACHVQAYSDGIVRLSQIKLYFLWSPEIDVSHIFFFQNQIKNMSTCNLDWKCNSFIGENVKELLCIWAMPRVKAVNNPISAQHFRASLLKTILMSSVYGKYTCRNFVNKAEKKDI